MQIKWSRVKLSHIHTLGIPKRDNTIEARPSFSFTQNAFAYGAYQPVLTRLPTRSCVLGFLCMQHVAKYCGSGFERKCVGKTSRTVFSFKFVFFANEFHMDA